MLGAMRRSRWIWLPLLAVAIAVAAAGVAFVLVDRDDDAATATTRARTSTVPSVVGMLLSDGYLHLSSSGYQAQVEETASDRPAQEILRQAPEPGSELERRGLVFLVVSSGRPPAAEREVVREGALVPDVTGRSQVGAGAELERLGFRADTYPVPADAPPGTVVAQDPDPGLRLSVPGEPVWLTVSRGRGRQPEVTVPNVQGARPRAARAAIRAADLTVRTVERVAATRMDVGKVMLQDPAGGTAVLRYAQISLFVGR